MEASKSSILYLSSLYKGVPEDVLIEILLRLPVSSLLRFKSVCKTWYNLVKSPYFISMHHKFNLRTKSQLLISLSGRHREEDICKHEFSFHSDHKSVQLQIPVTSNTSIRLVGGSCHGVVCYFDAFSAVFLSNPATREFRQLPPTSFPPGTPELMFYQAGAALGFHSSDIYDFKVLRLFSAVGEGLPNPISKAAVRVEMFTLSTNTWKQLHWGLDWGLDDDSLLSFGHAGLFCANSFHFIVRRSVTHLPTPHETTIVCCDIRTEGFRTIQLPATGEMYFRSIKLFKEFLSLVCTVGAWNLVERWLEIWIMKDYGVVESWTKLYKFGPPFSFAPICFWMEDNSLLLWEDETKKLVSFHLNTRNIEGVPFHVCATYPQYVLYKETLVSVM